MANVTYYLKIDTVPGEVKVKPYQGWIEIRSYSMGQTQTGSYVFGGSGDSGKVVPQDFHFTMPMNKASANLANACASGRHIPTATLVALRDGNEYLRVEMKEVYVTSYQNGGSSSGDVVPTDSVSLNYKEISYKYTDAKSKTDGASGTARKP